jgi:hypothetical protein
MGVLDESDRVERHRKGDGIEVGTLQRGCIAFEALVDRALHVPRQWTIARVGEDPHDNEQSGSCRRRPYHPT